MTSTSKVESAVRNASSVFEAIDTLSPHRRSSVMYDLAKALEDERQSIVDIARSETSLTTSRLEGELDRTAGQLRLYADALIAIVDDEETKTLSAKVSNYLRTMSGIGPVANLESSNFPLAFGALGTDTASALAAGCSVVVKTHPAHPRTSEFCVNLAREILGGVGLRDAIDFVHGDADITRQLVEAEPISAVTFVGSLSVGKKIIDLATARRRPIPVFAEMGSVNPVILTEGALSDAEPIGLAKLLVDSITGSGGQLCTKPGMVFIPLSSQGNKLVTEIERTIGNSGDFELIDERIEKRFALRIQEVTRVVGLVRHDGGAHGAWLFEHNLNEDSIPSPKLTDEIFGPASIIFRYSKLTQVLEVLQMIGGQLAVALYATESDGSVVPELACRLLRFAGRIVWCGVPTGVAVVDAMHHGGPWPASNSVIGSVGPEAILRFRRPVTWQGFPTFAMPLHLRPGHQEKDSFKVFTRSSDLA